MRLPVLPSPEACSSWQEYAHALNRVLREAEGEASGTEQRLVRDIAVAATTGGEDLPVGYKHLWYSQADAKLFLSNPAFDPPAAQDIVYIDTAALADAAVELEKIRDGAVGPGKYMDASILTAKIGAAQILSVLIGEAQIVSGKIADLAVNTGKIANLAVGSGKIANLSIGSAQMLDGSIVNAKIGNEISSYNWNPSTKTGWRLSKDAGLEGQAITIYNPDGTVAFASGSGGGGGQAGATIGVNLSGMFTAANISTYIQAAAIGRTLIADAAIGRAQIADAAIGTTQIADASIISAKVLNLVVDKIISGRLDAAIEVGDGNFTFTVGGSKLVLGNGFGTANQFFLWFGPVMSLALMAENNATLYLKTNGDAYFGGQILQGNLSRSALNNETHPGTEALIDNVVSMGGVIRVTLQYNFYAGGLSSSPDNSMPSADLRLMRSIGGGAEVAVFTTTVNGTHGTTSSTEEGFTTYDKYQAISFLHTYEDPQQSDLPRNYRWQLLSRNSALPGVTQQLKITSREF